MCGKLNISVILFFFSLACEEKIEPDSSFSGTYSYIAFHNKTLVRVAVGTIELQVDNDNITPALVKRMNIHTIICPINM